MSYTAPSYAHLPNINWSQTGTPARADINSVATSPEDTQAQVAADNAPLRVVYGQARIGAQIADVLVYQSKLVVLAVWCQGPIEAITQVWQDDAAPPAGVVATHYTGAAGQTANATLIAAYAAAGIAYADTLPGVAYSVFVVPAGESSGFPTFAATIKGRKLYDPRTTLTAWSDNPALALADFLADADYGMARTVDWLNVEAAADACDELVGGSKRRRIGLCLDTVSECRQWLEALRAYAGCWVTPGAEGYRLIPDRPAASVLAFDAGNIAAGSLRLRKRGVQQVPTVVDVRYTDTSLVPWSEKSAIVKLAGVDSGATPRRESQVSLPGVQTYAQAYREAIERLNHFNLEDLDAEWETFDEALSLEVGDVVTVTHPIGLTAKLLRVTGIQSRSAGRWGVTAKEYDPAAYSDTVQAEPTFSDTDLPNPAAPPSLTGLALAEEVYQLENGTYSSRIRATWDDAGYAYLANYRIEVYQAGTLIQTGTSKAAAFATQALQEALEYVVKVAAVTTIGATGTWSQANLTAAGKYLIPGDVPSVQVFEAGGRVYVSWGAAVDLDIWRYEVRYGPTAGTWDSSTLIDRVDALRLTSDQIPTGTWKVWVKALDSVGQYSTTAATATVVVTSDAAAFFVDSYDSTTPTLTNMAAYTLAPSDPATYYVTEDGAMFGTKYSNQLATYGNPLATYHASITSTWLGEAEDFGQLLGGQWTGIATVAALSGSLTSYLGISADGSSWAYTSGLSAKANGRFGRIKHEALTTSTLNVTVPQQTIRLDAIPREEVGTGTSSASAAVTVTLENDYVAVKKLTITPEGNTARSATYDNVILGNPTTFDVHVFNDAGARIASAFRYEFQGV